VFIFVPVAHTKSKGVVNGAWPKDGSASGFQLSPSFLGLIKGSFIVENRQDVYRLLALGCLFGRLIKIQLSLSVTAAPQLALRLRQKNQVLIPKRKTIDFYSGGEDRNRVKPMNKALPLRAGHCLAPGGDLSACKGR
jgi:hypothetical protein